jgi:type IV pilus assembly protein PilQ
MNPFRAVLRAVLPVLVVAGAAVAPLRAQQAPPRQASRVSASFEEASMADVLSFFARYSGRSIVAGAGVVGTVTAQVDDQPWDQALDAILGSNGLYARELESGIILVENPRTAVQTPGRVVTRVFRASYTPAAELEPAVKSMLSAKGTVATVPSLNALVVTDEERVIERVAAILGQR